MYPVRQTDKDQRDRIAHEAADWHARLATGSADPALFEQWRAQSPQHAIAIARVVGAWEMLEQVGEPAAVSHVPARRRFLRAAGVLATGALAVGLLAERAAAWPRVETAIGERKLAALPGGNRAMLNTDSAVSWHRSGREMRITLERGEVALQLVGQDAIVLEAGGHGAMLSAGRFDARFEQDRLEVAVLSGSARTLDAGPARAGLHQALLVGSAGGTAVAASDRIERAMAWQAGEILFQDEPLSAAVADYNRYLQRKIVIVDPALGSIRVGGRFTTTDPAPFLRGLHEGLGIAVDSDATGFSLRHA